MRVPAALFLLSVVCVTGCGPDRSESGAGAPTRDQERRAVMRAVLTSGYAKGHKRFVLDPRLLEGPRPLVRPGSEDAPADGRAPAGTIELPNGHRVEAPRMEGIDPRLVADWAVHARAAATPTDLDLPLPVVWFSEAEWEALEGVVLTGGFDTPKWQAFHHQHPDSAGWVQLSDVGLSPGGDQALLYVTYVAGSLDGAGTWYRLEKRDGEWTVAETQLVWIS